MSISGAFPQGGGDGKFLPLTGGTLSGNLTLKGSGNFGTKINFGDGDYVHISEPTDDNMEIKAKSVSFITTASPGITANNLAIRGVVTASASTLYTANETTVTMPNSNITSDALVVVSVNPSSDSNYTEIAGLNLYFKSQAAGSITLGVASPLSSSFNIPYTMAIWK